MLNITFLLLIAASIITSEQSRRTIVDIPLTGIDSRFTEEANKKDWDDHEIKKFLSTRQAKQSFSYKYTIKLKHNVKKKENKKEKMYDFKYKTACICKDWKCDWRRSGHGSEDISRYRDDAFNVINFFNTLHKYNNELRKGGEKIKMQRNCQCLRKVCPTRSKDDFHNEYNTQDIDASVNV
ncbi:PREDICTED: uncharacterized protein LOC106119137 [Papilio xuthus]|uniref:Uncharacterized protein LOC106119137 n=1 Tax=Papilio xuthus TaxID=66420 RepID=A0AAJ6ZC79_PAPXU|nr:PREDICTED: uncharacterized protein LOC106119137 [Papilio xuthus]